MFTVELKDYEVEEGVFVDLTVRGKRFTGPGCCRGEPDTLELEILEVVNARGCHLPGAVVKALESEDRFLGAVFDAVTER